MPASPNRYTPRLTITAAVAALLLAGGCGFSAEESNTELALQGFYTAALSTDGKQGVVGSIVHGGSLWDLTQGERLFNWNHKAGGASEIVASAISGDGSVAATADGQRTIVLWSISEGKSLGFWSAPGEIRDLALTERGGLALLGLSDNRVVLFNIREGGVLTTLLHEDIVNSVDITPDSNLAISGSDDYHAKLWDTNSGRLLQDWDLGNKLVTVALSSNGRYALTAAQSGRAVIWDSASGEVVHELNKYYDLMTRGSTYSAARFIESDNQLLLGTTSGEVFLFDIDSGTISHKWQLSKRGWWEPTGVSVMALAMDPGTNKVRALGSNGLSYQLAL
ncbi:WD40 repeat domain-containing protein [Aestuariirhabdus sp. LZHN29]|uniref:WD40 repeat domain-containing protein n=1 Tax=Aestuariirhabdus sp. LZHN29 TaxID=3417462 RepID=UPI003CEE6145